MGLRVGKDIQHHGKYASTGITMLVIFALLFAVVG